MTPAPPAAPYAPILLIAFKRPLSTLQALYSLSRCPEAAGSELYAYCDGPRRESERRDVELTHEVIRAYPWCGRVELVAAESNLGCARAVIESVTEVCQRHGRVIVVEDDLVVSRGFLRYMNEALRRYAGEERVMTISGHTFDGQPPGARSVFYPAFTGWGWATWSRAWSLLQQPPVGLSRLDDPAFRRSFDLDGSCDYTGLLRATLAGDVDTWDILWWWTIHHHHGLSLYPTRSLVTNGGTGDSATHTHGASPLLAPASFQMDNEIVAFPDTVEVDAAAFDAWKRFLVGTQAPAAPAGGVRARARGLARRLASALPEDLVRIARRVARGR